MKDSIRESLSYWGLYSKMLQVKKEFVPQHIPFGDHRHQYFLYYEPDHPVRDKVIVWVHGGRWNAGTPKVFDFVGQCVAKNGYRFLSMGTDYHRSISTRARSRTYALVIRRPLHFWPQEELTPASL